jgi:hypothetical protein
MPALVDMATPYVDASACIQTSQLASGGGVQPAPLR